MSKYPEHDKVEANEERISGAREFVEWLMMSDRFEIVSLDEEESPVSVQDPMDLVSEAFGINDEALEAEMKDMIVNLGEG